jgi:diadenosine tetraphosphate (Ap4A) HIT family hydrolase
MYAVPGYSPQVFPYLLIISRRHFISLAHSNAAERESLFQVLRDLNAQSFFGSNGICVFEHGGCGNEPHSCIDHFHLHVVDRQLDLLQSLKAEYDTEEVTVTTESVFPATGRYLFAGCFDQIDKIDGLLVRSPDPETQYFRRKIAELTHQPLWDWRAGINSHLMLRVMEEAVSTPKRPDSLSVPGARQTDCNELNAGGCGSTVEDKVVATCSSIGGVQP